MQTTQFTTEQLQLYFSGKQFHKAYDETTKLAADIMVHASGNYPKSLIEERRPSESQAVKDYREKIWQPITKDVFSKVVTSLNKIRRSSDWSIKFDATKQSKKIIVGEQLNDYCENNFPYFDNITNWAFGVLLKAYLIDANALICIYPISQDAISNELIKPYPFIFYSNQVIDYVQDNYCVLLSTDKVLYGDEKNKTYGDVYYIITTQSIQRYEQIDAKRSFKLAWEFEHGLDELPVFKTKGVFKQALDSTFIFESRIAGIVPRLNEAVREYSDLQAGIVQSLYPEKWEFVSDDCDECKGKGTVEGSGFLGNRASLTCKKCNGTGGKQRGPYSTLQLKPPMAGEMSMPTPPMGFVQKDTAIIGIQDSRIDRHIYKALAAINMEFLVETPMAQSGIAKEVDRDELNNFVHSIGEDIVAILDRTIYLIGEMRYRVAVDNKLERQAMLPIINVPDKFDIISSSVLEQELLNARNARANPIIINAVEVEYANKKFSSDETVKDKVMLMISLDPQAGVSEDDKMTKLQNGGITKETYIISCNIQEFIAKAVDENPDFAMLELKQQKEIILKYAQEQIAQNSVAATILSSTSTG